MIASLVIAAVAIRQHDAVSQHQRFFEATSVERQQLSVKLRHFQPRSGRNSIAQGAALGFEQFGFEKP